MKDPGDLSGVSCPGLIEACCSADPGDGSGAYPGFLAPASLKPSGPGQREPCHVAYPGFLAPASLKPGGHGGRSCRRRAYPGFLAPASLKQEKRGPDDRANPGLIRGFLPRPH